MGWRDDEDGWTHTTGELRAKAMAAGRAARLRDLSMVIQRGDGERGEREDEECKTMILFV